MNINPTSENLKNRKKVTISDYNTQRKDNSKRNTQAKKNFSK